MASSSASITVSTLERITDEPQPRDRPAACAFGGLSDFGETVRKVEGVDGESEGGAKAGHLVEGRTD